MRLFMIFICAIAFCGCFSKIPQKNLYEIGFLDSIDLKAKNKKVAFSEIEVSAKIASTKIAYKTSKNSIAYFANNAWVAPLPTLLSNLAQKSANALNVVLLDSTSPYEPLKISVLDLYFDAKREVVVCNVLAHFRDSKFLSSKEVNVPKGDFSKIIEAFEIATNNAFLEIFSKL